MNNSIKNSEYYKQLFRDYPDVVKTYHLKEMLPKTGKNKIYKLLQTGEIPSKKIGTVYYIPKINIINYLINF